MLHKKKYIYPQIFILSCGALIITWIILRILWLCRLQGTAGHSATFAKLVLKESGKLWPKKKIGTTRRSDRTSKVNTISESSNRDVQMRQNVTGRERMKDPNDELDQITEKEKQSNIKRGHPPPHPPFLTSRVQRRLITGAKCSSLPPFSVRVIKDMSALGDESQPGCSLLTGGTERLLGPNKDMI